MVGMNEVVCVVFPTVFSRKMIPQLITNIRYVLKVRKTNRSRP